jgi:hypothetical protein
MPDGIEDQPADSDKANQSEKSDSEARSGAKLSGKKPLEKKSQPDGTSDSDDGTQTRSSVTFVATC